MRNAWVFHLLVIIAALMFCARPASAQNSFNVTYCYASSWQASISGSFASITQCAQALVDSKSGTGVWVITCPDYQANNAFNKVCNEVRSSPAANWTDSFSFTATLICTSPDVYDGSKCVPASLGPRDCAEYAQQVRDNPPPADVIFTSITPGCQGLDSGYDNGCIVNLGEYGPNSHYVLSVGGSCTAEPPAAPQCPSGQTNIGTVAIPLCTPSFSVIDPIPTSTQSEADKAALEAVAAVANSGGTAAQASAAGQAAAAAITSGGTGAQAAAAGAAAGAAVGGAVAGFGDVAGATAGARASEGFGATESTQQEVLKQLKSDSLFSSLGAVPVDDKIPTQGIVVTYNPLSFLNSPSCPSPITYSMLGISRDISYQSACDFLDNLRPLILAFATITVAIIYIRGFTPS